FNKVAVGFDDGLSWKYMLDDGKSTIEALMQLKAEYAAGTLGPCCEKLTQVLVSGELVVQAVHYPSGDTLERFAFNAHAHDEENNTFLPTTVATKIKLIKSIKATVPGSEWNLVQTWLEGRYGVAKRSSIKRTIAAAKCVSDRVVEFIDERAARLGAKHGMTSGYILGNDYFCSLDAKKQSTRLSDEEQLVAVTVMAKVLDDGASLTIDTFQKAVCRPIKFACVWVKHATNQYSDVLGTPDGHSMKGAIDRTRTNLLMNDGSRAKVVECIATNQQLAPTIVECKVLVDSLKAVRARLRAPALSANSGANCDEAGDALDLELESIAVKGEQDKSRVECRTPEERTADAKAQMHMGAVATFSSQAEFKAEVVRRVTDAHTKSDWVILLDASNTARRVQTSYLELIKSSLSEKVTGRIVCMVGPSMGNAAACSEQMARLWPRANVYDTKVTQGSEHADRSRGSRGDEYIITVELPNAKNGANAIPHILVTTSRGTPSDAMVDRENTNFEAMLEDMMQSEDGGGSGKKIRRWSFARPVATYSAVLRQIGRISACKTCIMVSCTASSNSILAAHAAFAEMLMGAGHRIFALVDRPSARLRWHGQQALLTGLRAACAPAASSAFTSAGCLLENLQLIVVPAASTTVDIADVSFAESPPLSGIDIAVDIRARARAAFAIALNCTGPQTSYMPLPGSARAPSGP
ncbi:unnamed protein product, partial [Prorocentrum cordatum]